MSKELPSHPDFYRKIASGFKVEIDDYKIEPMTYQPSPSGLFILSNHYKDKYGVDIRIIDHTESVEKGDNLKDRFTKFKTFLDENKDDLETEISSGKQIGFILSHGFNHVVPLMISLDKDKNKIMTIFDSSSGPRTKGYHIIANILEDFTILLNKGTRQSDGYSCSNDAIAILKDALRMPDLAQYLLDHKINETPTETTIADGRPTFFITPLNKPEKFKIFLMPEELLKTAQISSYVTNAEADLSKIITKGNKTLEQKRNEDITTVSFNRKPEEEIMINKYLHEKGRKYAEIICKDIEQKITPSPNPTSPEGSPTKFQSEEDLFIV